MMVVNNLLEMYQVIIWVSLIPILILILKRAVKRIEILYYAHQIPGPPADSKIIPFNIWELQAPPEIVFKTVRKNGLKYYPLYKYYAFAMELINIVSPEDFELIMSNTKHNTKGDIYNLLHIWLGSGLLTSEGATWQRRRKILTPSFHFNILQEFLKVFHEETDVLVGNIAKQCQKPYVEVTSLISEFTLNSIGRTAMGVHLDKQTSEGSEYIAAVYEMGRLLVHKLYQPWLFNKWLVKFSPQFYPEKKVAKILHNFTTKVIKNREKNFQAKSPDTQLQDETNYSKRKRLAMLDLLLTAKREQGIIDDEGIREEVDTFMFEGHDTTSAAICFALMVLACNPQIQEKVVEEIEEVIGDNKHPDYQLLQYMKYLELVIKEVLRLYPSVPFMARYLGEDVLTASGFKLKKGTQVALHVYDVHHNPKFYPDPEKFDPDRFLPENSLDRHNFAYVPFSAGSRNCIGQKFAMLELKTVLCGILSKFILEPIDTPQTINLVIDIVLRTKDPIRVKFLPRHR